MHDIRSREDVEILVNKFYSKAILNIEIGYFFTKVINLDFNKHLPLIIDFWTSVLFGTGHYKGNPIKKHIDLHRHSPLKEAHFDIWLDLWNEAIDQSYQGPKADEAKQKASTMKSLMLLKINQSTNPNFIA